MFAKNCKTILEYLNKLTEVIIGCMSKDSDLKNEVSAILHLRNFINLKILLLYQLMKRDLKKYF